MHNKKNDNIIYICVFGLLIVLYVACFYYAEQGYGYPGYQGYKRPHSHFYVRTYNHYYNGISNRENSLSGSRYSRRGISGGK